LARIQGKKRFLHSRKTHTFPIEYINPFFFLPLTPAGTPNILKALRAGQVALHGRTRLEVLAELVDAR
jgi:hypothetical protein